MSVDLESIKNIFRFHKSKIALFFGAFLVFAFILFPINDLTDLISNTVSEKTNNQVFLQFDELGFTLLPKPGMGLKNVYLETAMAPPLNIESLTIAPSFRSLFAFQKGLSTIAQGFLGGEVSAAWRESGETSKGEAQQKIDVELTNIDLEELLELLESPNKVFGKASGETAATMDPSFSEQPKGQVALKINNFRFPASSIPTPMGAFPLPEIKISSILLKARLVAGELFVDQLVIGNSKDQINGNIKGKAGLKFSRRGIQVDPLLGRFDFDIDLKILPQKAQELQLVLGLLDSYKKPGIGYTGYCLGISGRNLYAPPNIVAKNNCQ